MLLFSLQNLYIQVWQFFTQYGGTDLHTHYSGQDEPNHHHTLLEVSPMFTSLVWSTSLKRNCLFTSFRANTFHISLNTHEKLLKELEEDEIIEN